MGKVFPSYSSGSGTQCHSSHRVDAVPILTRDSRSGDCKIVRDGEKTIAETEEKGNVPTSASRVDK